jgi:hypothetical protein
MAMSRLLDVRRRFGLMDGWIHDDRLRQDRGQWMTAYMTLTVDLDIWVARIWRTGVPF